MRASYECVFFVRVRLSCALYTPKGYVTNLSPSEKPCKTDSARGIIIQINRWLLHLTEGLV